MRTLKYLLSICTCARDRYKAVENLPRGRIVNIERLHWTLIKVDNKWKIMVLSLIVEKNL